MQKWPGLEAASLLVVEHEGFPAELKLCSKQRRDMSLTLGRPRAHRGSDSQGQAVPLLNTPLLTLLRGAPLTLGIFPQPGTSASLTGLLPGSPGSVWPVHPSCSLPFRRHLSCPASLFPQTLLSCAVQAPASPPQVANGVYHQGHDSCPPLPPAAALPRPLPALCPPPGGPR